MDNNIFYNYDRLISYNAYLNFLIGERGVGKTFGISEFVTNQFIKKNHEFAYIRRYKTDLEKGKKKFFKSLIKENKFPNNNLKIKGDEFLIDDKVAGYSFTLSTAHQIKSSNYPNVKYIIFDEFLIENGQSHYIKNEVFIFLGLIESIARMNDVNIFCLGNATDEINPYFMFFDISIPYKNDIKLFKEGLILVQYMENKPYREAKKKTKFGKLVSGTDYEEYAINNKFSTEDKNFIEKKSGFSKFLFSFIYRNNYYGVWIDYNNGKMYVSKDYLTSGLVFATTTEDQKPNTLLFSIAKKYYCWNIFIQCYKLGNVYYENNKIKNISKEVLKNIVLRS